MATQGHRSSKLSLDIYLKLIG